MCMLNTFASSVLRHARTRLDDCADATHVLELLVGTITTALFNRRPLVLLSVGLTG